MKIFKACANSLYGWLLVLALMLYALRQWLYLLGQHGSLGSWAIGCLFQFEDPALPGTYLSFPEPVNIGFNRGTRENIDLTNHESTKPFEEFLKGIATGAQLTVTCNFIPGNTNQQKLEDLWLEDAALGFRIVLNDTVLTTYSFQGYLTSFNSDHNTRDAHRGNFTISCTGAWSRGTGGS